MGLVPVAYVLAGGVMGCNKGLGPRRHNPQRVPRGTAIELEVVGAQICMSEDVNHKDALSIVLRLVSTHDWKMSCSPCTKGDFGEEH